MRGFVRSEDVCDTALQENPWIKPHQVLLCKKIVRIFLNYCIRWCFFIYQRFDIRWASCAALHSAAAPLQPARRGRATGGRNGGVGVVHELLALRWPARASPRGDVHGRLGGSEAQGGGRRVAMVQHDRMGARGAKADRPGHRGIVGRRRRVVGRVGQVTLLQYCPSLTCRIGLTH
jgi:hypothetical protein